MCFIYRGSVFYSQRQCVLFSERIKEKEIFSFFYFHIKICMGRHTYIAFTNIMIYMSSCRSPALHACRVIRIVNVFSNVCYWGMACLLECMAGLSRSVSAPHPTTYSIKIIINIRLCYSVSPRSANPYLYTLPTFLDVFN